MLAGIPQARQCTNCTGMRNSPLGIRNPSLRIQNSSLGIRIQKPVGRREPLTQSHHYHNHHHRHHRSHNHHHRHHRQLECNGIIQSPYSGSRTQAAPAARVPAAARAAAATGVPQAAAAPAPAPAPAPARAAAAATGVPEEASAAPQVSARDVLAERMRRLISPNNDKRDATGQSREDRGEDLSPVYPGQSRVFAVSDLHTDYKENMDWVEGLGRRGEDYSRDALIVAGDVSDDLQILERTLAAFKESFGAVFFTPGNHELWCRKEDGPRTSLAKLDAVMDCCSRLEVETRSGMWGDALIVPILSWYHSSFDHEPDLPFAFPSIEKTCVDFRACSWSDNASLSQADDSLARHFDALNDQFHLNGNILSSAAGGVHLNESIPRTEQERVLSNGSILGRKPNGSVLGSEGNGSTFGSQQSRSALWSERNGSVLWSQRNGSVLGSEPGRVRQVITFSHFLPRLELCPEKRMLFYPHLPKVSGSVYLERRLRRIHSQFGEFMRIREGKKVTGCHVFGHTHFRWDMTLEDVRYIQAQLGYPRERSSSDTMDKVPHLLYTSGVGLNRRKNHGYWSAYYSQFSRDPTSLELAPWVAKRYKKRLTLKSK